MEATYKARKLTKVNLTVTEPDTAYFLREVSGIKDWQQPRVAIESTARQKTFSLA